MTSIPAYSGFTANHALTNIGHQTAPMTIGHNNRQRLAVVVHVGDGLEGHRADAGTSGASWGLCTISTGWRLG